MGSIEIELMATRRGEGRSHEERILGDGGRHRLERRRASAGTWLAWPLGGPPPPRRDMLHEIRCRDALRGPATLCIGGGQGVAIRIER